LSRGRKIELEGAVNPEFYDPTFPESVYALIVRRIRRHASPRLGKPRQPGGEYVRSEARGGLTRR